MPSIAGLDLIKEALQEIGAYSQFESLSAEDGAFGLSKLNAILDAWNARELMIFNVDFTETYTLTPNLQPHTIGPTGTFTVATRPVKIESAAIVLTTSTPNVHCPLRIRDKDWYASLTVPALASSLPTDLYYAPTFPNGSLYLCPKPDTAYKLKLETWTQFSQATLVGQINLPPGYKEAMVLSLALRLCPAFHKTPDPYTVLAQMKAMQIVQGPNSAAPRISTDIGLSGGGGYDYRTGGIR